MDPSLEERVRRFISDETHAPFDRITLDTTLSDDLRIGGDDGVELLEAFGKQFNVDLQGCDPWSHFGPEGWFLPTELFYLIRKLILKKPHPDDCLVPIRVRDLVESAKAGRWTLRVSP